MNLPELAERVQALTGRVEALEAGTSGSGSTAAAPAGADTGAGVSRTERLAVFDGTAGRAEPEQQERPAGELVEQPRPEGMLPRETEPDPDPKRRIAGTLVLLDGSQETITAWELALIRAGRNLPAGG